MTANSAPSVTTMTTSIPSDRTSGRTHRRPVRVSEVLIHVLLVVMVVSVLLPFLWLVFASFKTYADLLGRPGHLPSPWTLASYREIFSIGNFGTSFVNSVLVAVGRVLVACVTSLVLGYIFAKYRFVGKGIVFGILLSTMLIPFPILLIPLYLRLVDFHLVDQQVALVIISVFSTFGTFLMRQWILGIPDSFIEAARIDGAGEVWIVVHIIAPLSAAPMAALAIITFLASWDDFLFPGVILSDPTHLTLPLALSALKSLYWERYDIFSAGAMLTIVPVMILYAFMQRHFIRGLTLGGTKG